MDFLILGPLELRDGDREVPVRGGKQRALLALLLLNANRTLAVGRIVDDLWGEEPPDSARKMVQIYVAKLRQDLPRDTVETRPPGYAVALEPGRLDLDRFETLVAQARAAADAEQAADRFRAALALWRGPALAEFASEPFAALESGRLEELRMTALEGRLEADLELGRRNDVAGELESLIARHPLRESLRRQHMLALYRSGRQAEALNAYRDAWRTLADELGIEPSPALRDLERLILQQDSSLDVARVVRAAPAPPAPEEILKLVTVLVANVAGSTATARHPEDVRDLMADYFAAMMDEIRAEGGTVEKRAGDTIMAVFGVPAVREDDAVRAVRAARRMVERLRSWNDERGPAEALEIRIGLSTGDVVVGADLSVTGDAVNDAAQHAAEPGTILVAERTARAVRSRFALLPQAAGWRVEAERATPTGTATPLVGRERELAVLRTTFDHVPALVTVIGDAGVGKSRLVREFLKPLEGEILIGRCVPGVSLAPLAEMLKTQAAVLETDDPDTACSKVARLVEASIEPDLVADRARTAAALASTLGLSPPPLQSLDPRELYRELVRAWRALLASLARRGPLVVVVEDLHWADPTMLDVRRQLAEDSTGRSSSSAPRADPPRPDWGGGRRSFSSLRLDPLSDEESARLVSYLPGFDELPDDVRREILGRAERQPVLPRGDRPPPDRRREARLGGRAVAGPPGIDQVKIPDNVHAVILARLDLLTPDERRVAQRAAVVGRVFWDGVLARTSRRSMISRRRYRPPSPRVRARAALVLDPATAASTCSSTSSSATSRMRACLGRERGRAHATTAAWIEETSSSAEVLAHRYGAAVDSSDPDLRRAGPPYASRRRRPSPVRESRRAIVSREQAVELSEGASEHSTSRLLEALGISSTSPFLGDENWRTYGEALAELSDGDPVVARIAGKATLCAARFIGSMQDIPDVDAVRAVIDRGLLAAPPSSPERTLLLVNRGFLMRQREKRDDTTAKTAVREALGAAEDLGDPDLLSAALDLAGNDEEQAGRHGEAYRISLRRLPADPPLDGRHRDRRHVRGRGPGGALHRSLPGGRGAGERVRRARPPSSTPAHTSTGSPGASPPASTSATWTARSPSRRARAGRGAHGARLCRPRSAWPRTRASHCATRCAGSKTRPTGTSRSHSATSRSAASSGCPAARSTYRRSRSRWLGADASRTRSRSSRTCLEA